MELRGGGLEEREAEVVNEFFDRGVSLNHAGEDFALVPGDRRAGAVVRANVYRNKVVL
jgi:hypothetical protein